MRLLLRFLGALLLAAAFVGLIIDGTRSIASNEIVLTPLGAVLFAMSPNLLNGAQSAAQRLSPLLWDPGAIWLLTRPAFAVAFVLALVLLVLGRPKRRPIGYEAG